jgi:hypothetical protein
MTGAIPPTTLMKVATEVDDGKPDLAGTLSLLYVLQHLRWM